jgi:hypothetical protein
MNSNHFTPFERCFHSLDYKKKVPDQRMRKCPQKWNKFPETRLLEYNKMGSDDEMQTVKPLREPLELNSAHFSPFELSLLEVASPVNRDFNRAHFPISPSILLLQDYTDLTQAVRPLREPLELNSAHFSRFELSLLQTANIRFNHEISSSQLCIPVSPPLLQEYPDSDIEKPLELSKLLLELRSRPYSPTYSTDRKPNGQYTPVDDQYHKTHPVTKTFTCAGCDKKFTSKKNIARHMKLHLNERGYECAVCNKRFNRIDYLKKHLKLH